MSENIYQPPSSDLEKPAYIYREGSSIKAIIYGLLVSILGKNIAGFIVILIFGSSNTTLVPGLLMIFSVLVSLYAGFVCAKSSISNIYRDTTMMYCAVLVIELTASIWVVDLLESNQTLSQQPEQHFLLVGFIILAFANFMFALLGAFLWKRKSS